jgi:transcriptional regulator GlxA family with amidase domain
MCLYLVRLDHGSAVANAVARRIVMPPFREGGQAQYVQQPIRSVAAAKDSFGALLDWARLRLGSGVSVHQLAQQAYLSPRSLRRQFQESVGMAPEQWLRGERLRRAQELLESTDEPVDRVAALAGFRSTAAMRALFASRLMVSPRRYRGTFRADPRQATGETR